jgi:hypothetical protein
VREESTISAWLDRIDRVGKSAGWNDTQKAGQAITALAPNSPANAWYNQWVKKVGQNYSWENFKKDAIEMFTMPATIMNRVGVFRAIKQAPKERSKDYGVRVRTKVDEYFDDVNQIWNEPEFNPDTGDKDLDKRINDLIRAGSDRVKEHLVASLYAFGAQDVFLKKITDHNIIDTDEMINACSLAEVSMGAPGQRTKEIAGMGLRAEEPDAYPGYQDPQQYPGFPEVLQEIRSEMAALKKLTSGTGAKPKQDNKKDRQPKDTSKATCY